MILYLDTSAFVRLYIEEAHHEDVWTNVRNASLVATHLIAYAEMRAAFAKMRTDCVAIFRETRRDVQVPPRERKIGDGYAFGRPEPSCVRHDTPHCGAP